MDREEAERLIDEARRSVLSGGAADFVRRIDDDLPDAHGVTRGLLLLARVVASQRHTDSSAIARDALDAVEALRSAGEERLAAVGSAFAAVMLHRSGEVEAAIDLAAKTLAVLEEFGNDDWVARAAHALGVLFGQLHAFDLAATAVRQALEAPFLRDNPDARAIMEFTRGYYAARSAESYRQGSEEWHAAVGELEASISWFAGTELPTAPMLTSGLCAELVFLEGGIPDPDRMVDIQPEWTDEAPTFVSWHEGIRGRALRVSGRPAEAIEHLRRCLSVESAPDLERARRDLAEALLELGRTEEAARELLEANEAMLRFHRDHVARLASELASRVQIERDAAELRRRSSQMSVELAVDHLTGVGSRRALEQRLDEPVDGRSTSAVLMCDLDHFKLVNDVYGHEAGDRVLERVGALLRAAVRSEDVVGRLGGEEFVVVMRGEITEAHEIAERLRLSFVDADWTSIGADLRVTTSIGVAAGTTPLRDLLRAADLAVYEAKRAGRNRTVRASVGAASSEIDRART